MKSVILAANSISSGYRDIMVAGGMESMSNVPFYFPRGHTFGNVVVSDGIIKDGLTDAYDDIHMGLCAEETAIEHNISRQAQDEHCIESYKRAKTAWDKGLFKNEIVPVVITDKKGKQTVIDHDEEYKNIDFSKVPKLNSAFKKGGSVTAANSSTLSDGASALVLSSLKFAESKNIKPIAKILGYADVACEPRVNDQPLFYLKNIFVRNSLSRLHWPFLEHLQMPELL